MATEQESVSNQNDENTSEQEISVWGVILFTLGFSLPTFQIFWLLPVWLLIAVIAIHFLIKIILCEKQKDLRLKYFSIPLIIAFYVILLAFIANQYLITIYLFILAYGLYLYKNERNVINEKTNSKICNGTIFNCLQRNSLCSKVSKNEKIWYILFFIIVNVLYFMRVISIGLVLPLFFIIILMNRYARTIFIYFFIILTFTSVLCCFPDSLIILWNILSSHNVEVTFYERLLSGISKLSQLPTIALFGKKIPAYSAVIICKCYEYLLPVFLTIITLNGVLFFIDVGYVKYISNKINLFFNRDGEYKHIRYLSDLFPLIYSVIISILIKLSLGIRSHLWVTIAYIAAPLLSFHYSLIFLGRSLGKKEKYEIMKRNDYTGMIGRYNYEIKKNIFNENMISTHILITIGICIGLLQFFWTMGDRSARYFIPDNAYVVACIYNPDIVTDKPNCRMALKSVYGLVKNELNVLQTLFPDKIFLIKEIEATEQYNSLFYFGTCSTVRKLFPNYDITFFAYDDLDSSGTSEVKIAMRPLLKELDDNILKDNIKNSDIVIENLEQNDGTIDREQCNDLKVTTYMWIRIFMLKMLIVEEGKNYIENPEVKGIIKESLNTLKGYVKENKNKENYFVRCMYILTGMIEILDEKDDEYERTIESIRNDIDSMPKSKEFVNWPINYSIGLAHSVTHKSAFLNTGVKHFLRALSDTNLVNNPRLITNLAHIQFMTLGSLSYLEKDTLNSDSLLNEVVKNKKIIIRKYDKADFYIAFAKENILNDPIAADADYTKIVESPASNEDVKAWAQFRKIWIYFEKTNWVWDSTYTAKNDFKDNTLIPIKAILKNSDLKENIKNNFEYLRMMYYHAVEPDSAKTLAKKLLGKEHNEYFLTIPEYSEMDRIKTIIANN